MDLKRKEARDLLVQAAGTARDFRALDKKSVALLLISRSSTMTAAQMLDGIMGVLSEESPYGQPCCFDGCVVHGPKILTTTAAFSDDGSPMNKRAPEEPNAADHVDIGWPHSAVGIASKDAAPVQAEIRPALEMDDEGWTTV